MNLVNVRLPSGVKLEKPATFDGSIDADKVEAFIF